VEFYDGTALVSTDSASPYTYAWSFTSANSGTHSWTAKAYDAREIVTPLPSHRNIDAIAPTVPTGLSAIAASCSQINLSWGASTDSGGSGLKGYNVYRNGSYLKQVLAPSTTTSDTGLVASTVYSYAVSAIDNAGNESAKSNTASTNTPACADTTAPSVPTELTATAVSSSQINLVWNASTDTGGSGLAGYKVYRGGSQP
jgi:fibronectin type 3 domain-containing protein